MSTQRQDQSTTKSTAKSTANGSEATSDVEKPSAEARIELDRISQVPSHCPWRAWGPYLSDRQWGTVREDYSADGSAWDSFSHDQARSRAYRWGEDGLAGFCDRRGQLCLSVSLWNGNDAILKERLFGLTNAQGNHGEDVKELYWHQDAVPSHAYQRMLYRYPQAAFPYDDLVAENARRGPRDREYELLDTGVLTDDRFFDVVVEYAKAAPDDLLMRITVHNRGPESAAIDVLPQVWFRNTWSWGRHDLHPRLRATSASAIQVEHPQFMDWTWVMESPDALLFCENESNPGALWNQPTEGFFKDGIHEAVVKQNAAAVNPDRVGSRACGRVHRSIEPGGQITLRVRLGRIDAAKAFEGFDAIFDARQSEADAFHAYLVTGMNDPERIRIHRLANAGLLWTKQYYDYDVREWLQGDPATPPPPSQRKTGRNRGWGNINSGEVLLMPDSWEYPWFAAWDLAFHCLSMARLDPALAKHQLRLFTREWYMHANGQLPAYEWAFGDVNPPVHAWAAWRVFSIDRRLRGDEGDLDFLEAVFHKLLLNFTWWVNRKDDDGRNVFEGGFLGLDNIGVFDRSKPLEAGQILDQADGTSWMAMYSLNMLRIAIELALTRPAYQDIATKFYEHFLNIAAAMNNAGGLETGLWDDEDGFYYDVLRKPDGTSEPMRARSMVGLIPLFAVEVLHSHRIQQLPEFARRANWLKKSRPDLTDLISRWDADDNEAYQLLSLLRPERLTRILRRMLDEDEFLSPWGIRSMSKAHRDAPFRFQQGDATLEVAYSPGESTEALFGGNSNWRGPIWFPVNFLIIESLQRYQHFYGDSFTVECPTGSGRMLTLGQVADELRRRLIRLFTPDEHGLRPCQGDNPVLQNDPMYRDHILFHEYFDGDTGRGCGASHQTGWTALIAKLCLPRRDGT